VFFSHAGAGTTNLVTAARLRPCSLMPMVIITVQNPYSAHRQARFQIIDAVSLMLRFTNGGEAGSGFRNPDSGSRCLSHALRNVPARYTSTSLDIAARRPTRSVSSGDPVHRPVAP